MFRVFGGRSTQYIGALTVSILTITVGVGTSWSSPILPMLEQEDSPIGVTLSTNEGTWITAIVMFGFVIGNTVLGPLLDKLGRKGLLLLSIIPLCGSWMMILFAKSFIVLLIGRIINGIADVVPSVGSVIYIGEISEPDIRGKLGMFNLLMLEFGIVFVTTIGSYTSYSTTAIVSAAIPLVFFVTFVWMPESPYYHMRKGNLDEATACLKRVRAKTNIEKEILDMQIQVEKEMSNESSILKVFRIAEYRKVTLIIIGLKTLQQMSGTIAINSYMKTIFNQVPTGLDSSQSSIVSTFISIPAMLLGSYLIDRTGRKPLYYVSTIGCSIALFCLSTYFYLKNVLLENDVTSLGWLPISGIIFFNVFRAVGVHTMPYIMISELLPTNIKGLVVSFTLTYSSALAFGVSLGFPFVEQAWGIHTCFLIFAVSCVIGFFFVLFYVPETKGKTFGDIQKIIENNCDNS